MSSFCAPISIWRQTGQAGLSKCLVTCRTIRACQGLPLTTWELHCCRPVGKKKRSINWKAGQLAADDPAALAIRDKSNLVLGALLFESGNFERAKQTLDRVRLEGPFSNQALLRAGWAEASAKQFDRALVP